MYTYIPSLHTRMKNDPAGLKFPLIGILILPAKTAAHRVCENLTAAVQQYILERVCHIAIIS